MISCLCLKPCSVSCYTGVQAPLPDVQSPSQSVSCYDPSWLILLCHTWCYSNFEWLTDLSTSAPLLYTCTYKRLPCILAHANNLAWGMVATFLCEFLFILQDTAQRSSLLRSILQPLQMGLCFSSEFHGTCAYFCPITYSILKWFVYILFLPPLDWEVFEGRPKVLRTLQLVWGI